MKLPTEGKTRDEVMALLERSMAGDLAWHEGRTFNLVYGAGEEHLRLLREAYALFMATNGLGAGRMFRFHVLGDPAMYVWGFASDAIDVMARAGYAEAVLWTLADYPLGQDFYRRTGWSASGEARAEGRQVAFRRRLR